MTGSQRVAAVAGTALAYFLLCELNALLFSFFDFSNGVSWIFLPSGLRLVFILILGVWGAMGIVLSSVVVSAVHHFDGFTITALGAGLVSGLSPLLARRLCVDFFKLNVNLVGLTASTLIKLALIFALVSATLHQIWFSLQGVTDNFLSGVMVMATGDLLGTILVLYAAKFLFRAWPSSGQR